MKRIAIIFLSALLLNILWENLHAFLYSNYQGGQITEFILIRASLFDALLITVIALPFVLVTSFKNKTRLIFTVGVIVAVMNEWYGLGTGRWAYNELMPVIPVLGTGLTPTFQLGILGYLAYKISDCMSSFYNPPRKL